MSRSASSWASWNTPVEERPQRCDEQTDHPALSERIEQFWQAGPALAELRLSPSEPRPADASVRSLDPLERDMGGRAIVEVLHPFYEAITVGARAQLLSTDDTTA